MVKVRFYAAVAIGSLLAVFSAGDSRGAGYVDMQGVPQDGASPSGPQPVTINVRDFFGGHPGQDQLVETAIAALKQKGVEVVDPVELPAWPSGDDPELTVLLYELKADLDAYLATANAPVKSLADVIAFDKAHADEELRWFNQDLFEKAETITAAQYRKAHAANLRLAGPEGIDRLLAANKVSLLIAPTMGPAWTTDLVNGDHFNGSIGATSLAAIAGYPHLTVPMGAVEGLPVGLSFIGPKWSDHALLLAGAAYERARTATLPKPTFKPWAPAGE